VSSTVEEDAFVFRTLQRLTNKRQASKVCDVSQAATLVARWDAGRSVWIRATDEGLRVIGIGSGGGFYMSRVLEAPQVTALVDGADTIDVVHDRDDLPKRVREQPGRQSR